VDEVAILPLVERLAGEGSGLRGEPGVSYLVSAGGERDAEHVLAEIEARGPRLVALSGHDSTPWTYDAFARRFGERYRTLRAGEELRISAALMP
jgi:hypothetical protein